VTSDISAILIDAMPALVGCPCDTELPDPRPARFLRVVDAGGPGVRDIVLDEVHVEWEASSTVSPADACDLAGTVQGAFAQLAGAEWSGCWITDASSTRPRWFPDRSDPAGNLPYTPRYTGTATILIQDR
jgi:hypothetical protein